MTTTNPTMQGGGGTDEPRVGLVIEQAVAGGNGSTTEPCKYCGEIDGHTAQCPTVSEVAS